MPSHTMGRSFTTQGVAIFAIKVLHSSHPCSVCNDSGENNGVCSQHTLNLRAEGHHLLSHQMCAIHHTLASQMSGRLMLTKMGQRKESSLTTAACPYAWHPGGSLLSGTKDQQHDCRTTLSYKKTIVMCTNRYYNKSVRYWTFISV